MYLEVEKIMLDIEEEFLQDTHYKKFKVLDVKDLPGLMEPENYDPTLFHVVFIDHIEDVVKSIPPETFLLSNVGFIPYPMLRTTKEDLIEVYNDYFKLWVDEKKEGKIPRIVMFMYTLLQTLKID